MALASLIWRRLGLASVQDKNTTHQATIINRVMGIEGGESDNPDDSGGKTNFGVTERLALQYDFYGDMSGLTEQQARHIYIKEFWEPLGLHRVADLSPTIAFELMEFAVNAGVSRSAEYFQRCLNVFNKQGVIYDDITVDGIIGPKTLSVFGGYLECRPDEGETVLLRAMNSLQGAFYVRLAERRQKDETFIFGWLLNRVH